MNPTDIIDDLTLVPLPAWWENPWIWLAVVAGLLGLAWAGRRWWLGRRPAIVPATVAPVATFTADEALRQLESIKARLPGLSHYDFSIEASGILRLFIEGQHRLPILFQTTGEFLQAATDRPELAAPQRELLARFLGGCDLAKFAAHPATTAEMGETLDLAIRFVAGARPDGAGKDVRP